MGNVENTISKEIEKDLSELPVTERIKESELRKYIGEKFSNGFTIDKSMAHAILQSVAPNRISDEIKDYTITTVGDTTMLIGRNSDGVVEFTVEMTREVEPVLASPDFEDRLKYFQENTERYKSARWFFYFGVVALLCIFGVAMYFISKYV